VIAQRNSGRVVRPAHGRWIQAGAAAALVLALLPVSARSSSPDEDIAVHVRKDGQQIVVDVDCPVDAPPSIVWDVLTDFDRMAQFMSNLKHSGVTSRVDDVLRVHQTVGVSVGLVKLNFDNVREIELVPYREIRSRLVSGDLKASESVTRIVETGARVHIVNSGRFTTKMWVPPYIGPALFESATRKQFGEIRTEIRRRSALARPQT